MTGSDRHLASPSSHSRPLRRFGTILFQVATIPMLEPLRWCVGVLVYRQMFSDPACPPWAGSNSLEMRRQVEAGENRLPRLADMGLVRVHPCVYHLARPPRRAPPIAPASSSSSSKSRGPCRGRGRPATRNFRVPLMFPLGGRAARRAGHLGLSRVRL